MVMIPRHRHVFPAFARCLRYPHDGPAEAAMAANLLAALLTAEGHAESFARAAGKALCTMTPTEAEESFTRTFDVNPVVTLDVGFHLFGLAYQRGEFLVRVQAALTEYGVNPGAELPDHLPTLLVLAAAMDDERTVSLVEECIAPAVRNIAAALDHEAASGEPSAPWALILRALDAWLRVNFGCVVYRAADESGGNAPKDMMTAEENTHAECTPGGAARL